MGAPGGVGLAVVGGGPAGCAAAATAPAAGLDVVLYSAGPSPWLRPCESLPPGAAQLVDEIFAPGAFKSEDHLPAYANASTWGSAELETADFIFNPFGQGWHLDRPAFDGALLDAVRRMGVRVVEQRAATVAEARFVVDATGRSARIARSRGARRRRFDRLVAVWRDEAERTGSVTTVAAERNGWSYTAPGISAFLTDADLLPRLPGQATDASTSCLDRVVGPGWAATGDAAVAFDPLSSQGLVTARDGPRGRPSCRGPRRRHGPRSGVPVVAGRASRTPARLLRDGNALARLAVLGAASADGSTELGGCLPNLQNR